MTLTIVFLGSLGIAQAATETKIQRLLEKGAADKAKELCHKDKTSGDISSGPHQEACAKADWLVASAIADKATRERELREVHKRWIGTNASVQSWEDAATIGFGRAGQDANERAAAAELYSGSKTAIATCKAEWEALLSSPTSSMAQEFATVWPQSSHRSAALALATSLDFESAQTVEALQAFLTKWPDAPQKDEAAALIVQKSLSLSPSCETSCPAVRELQASWTPPGDIPVSMGIVARQGDSHLAVLDAYRSWAGPLVDDLPLEEENIEETRSAGQWSVEFPFPVKAHSAIDHYELLISVGQQTSTVPLNVTQRHAPVRTGFLYSSDNALFHQPDLESKASTIAEGLGKLTDVEVVGDTAIISSEQALTRVPLGGGPVETLIASPGTKLQQFEQCWVYSEGHLFRPSSGQVVPLPEKRYSPEDILAVNQECSHLAAFDSTKNEIRIHDLVGKSLLATHKVTSNNQSWLPEDFNTSLEWSNGQLYISYSGYDIWSFEVDWENGTETDVNEVPIHTEEEAVPRFTSQPSSEQPNDVALEVRTVGGYKELFATRNGVSTQVTDNAHSSVVLEDDEMCEPYAPSDRRVTATVRSVGPFTYLEIEVVDQNCGDVGDMGPYWSASLDGQRIDETPMIAPDHLHVLVGQTVHAPTGQTLVLPTDARIVEWFPTNLQYYIGSVAPTETP